MSTSVTKPFTEVAPSRTASRATIYIPPDATGSYYGPEATTTTRPHVPDPSTPAFINDFQWINSYLIIHKMTTPSYRYSFLLWILLVLVVLVFIILHWTGSRGGFLGAAWSKWALRRRTWRKKHALAQAARDGTGHKQPFSFPSNAQMLSLVFLFVIPLALCVIGPDYIAPGTKLWDLAHNMTRRATRDDRLIQLDLQSRAIASTATTRSPEYTIPKAWWTAGGRTGIIAFSLFPLVTLFSLKSPPFAVLAIPFLVQIHFDKLARLHRWTGRLIWFITTVHVFTWGVQLGRDKRGTGNYKHSDAPAWMFVWQYPLFIEGVIAYIALTALVILSLDSFRVRYYEAFYVLHIILVPTVLIFSALHFPTIWWWCWSALFLWVGERTHRAIRWAFVNGLMGKDKIPPGIIPPPMKLGPVHEKLKKAPPSAAARMQDWETGVRLVRRDGHGFDDPTLLPLQPGQEHGQNHGHGDGNSNYPRPLQRDASYNSTYDNSILDAYQDMDPNDSYNQKRMSRMSSYSVSMRDDPDKRGSHGTTGSNAELLAGDPTSPGSTRPLNISFQQDNNSPTYPPTVGSNSRYARIPPPGFALAQILPGRVVRLRLLTPRPITWAPGQHVLLQVPIVSKYQTHPFTISGCYDAESETGEGRVVELLIRAKNGFTKDLWDYIVQLSQSTEPAAPAEYPFGYGNDVENGHMHREKASPKKPLEPTGVLIRAYVDGPFGSSIRAHWGNHSSVLIIVGGTGVSFGVAILEYLSLCLAGRDGQSLGGRPGGWGRKGFKTTRVRFIWLVREFSHIQWCATILRRCMEMVPSSALQVDIFVTNPTEVKANRSSVLTDIIPPGRDEFAPPSAQFMGRARSGSNSSVQSEISAGYSAANSTVDLSYLQPAGEAGALGGDYYLAGELGHEGHILDYTNFDGEVDTRAPGEAGISKRLQKEGKIRRAKSRKASNAQAAKAGFQSRSTRGQGATTPVALPMIDIPSERDPFRSNTSPRDVSLPQGAYSPIAKRLSHPPTSFDPKHVVSAADQYRLHDAYLSPTEPASHGRWSGQGMYRAPSPGFRSTDDFRLSVTSIGDISRGISPGPGMGTESVHRLVGDRPDSRQSGDAETEPRLEISDQELEDVNFVSEMTRPGKPKIDRILADEVGRSRGAVAVACCGPASLNALVRKIVAAQINPRQVMRGEMQGMLTLITEEFQW